MALVARMRNLVRGWLAHWVRRREHANPEAVYESAIAERVEQYTRLRSAAAGVLYLRAKLERELDGGRAALAVVERQLEQAVVTDDDATALVLIERRRSTAAELERRGAELVDLAREAEAAKRSLRAFHADVARLREEKTRMLARLAHAKARLRLTETLAGLSVEPDLEALEAVREHVHRLLAEVDLAREQTDGDLERRLAALRDDADEAAARAELEERKRARDGRAASAA